MTAVQYNFDPDNLTAFLISCKHSTPTPEKYVPTLQMRELFSNGADVSRISSLPIGTEDPCCNSDSFLTPSSPFLCASASYHFAQSLPFLLIFDQPASASHDAVDNVSDSFEPAGSALDLHEACD